MPLITADGQDHCISAGEKAAEKKVEEFVG